MTLDSSIHVSQRRGRSRRGARRAATPQPGARLFASADRGAGGGGPWSVVLLLVLAQAAVATDLHLPLVRPVLALVTLLGVPTLVLYRRAGPPGEAAVVRLLYAFGLSLLGLVLGGLLLNEVLPFAGVDRPLQPAVLAATWLVVDLALLAWRASVPLFPARPWRTAVRRALDARWELAPALAAGSVLLAVLGAIRLNNGAGGGVALVAPVLAAAAVLALLLRPQRTLGRDALVLALVSAGLLLATSLRGWRITGHDIQAEFLVFRLTNDAQHWQMGALQSAYNACLSVNILPTVLTQTTGLPGEVVFKVLLQLVYALVPVLAFLFARRLVSRRLALVAAVFTIAFPTFFTDMPYLVRQEVAYFFLALLLLAATEPGRRHRWRAALVAVLGVGVVLSHYSTTYVLLMALVLGLLVRVVAAVGRRILRRRDGRGASSPLVLLRPVTVGFLVAVTLAWAGPITHTGGHASTVAHETIDALTGKSEGPGSSDVAYWLFSRDHTTPRERMHLFVKATLQYRAAKIPPGERLLPHLARPELRPKIVPKSRAPLTALGRRLDSVGIRPSYVDTGAKLACAVAMQVFLLLGLVWLVRRRRGRDTGSELPGGPEPAEGRGASGPTREVAYLTIGAEAALALIVLVPNLSVDYGVLRAFQQTLLVVAPSMAVGMSMALRPFGRRPVLLTAAVPVVLILVLTGTLQSLVGGQQQRIAVANAGLYYDRYFVSDSEARAVSWLGDLDQVDHTNERVIGSRNVNVRLLAATENRAPVSDRLFPTLLTKHSYVYLGGQVVDKGVSTVFYTGDLLTYVYPTQDLDQHLDLVYSSPRSRIYR